MNFPDSGCYRMERAWCTDFRAKSLALRRMQKVPGRPFCVSTLSLVLLRFRREQKSKGKPLKMQAIGTSKIFKINSRASLNGLQSK